MRSNAFLIALVLGLSYLTGCKEEGYVRPDPEQCQPMAQLISAVLSDGTAALVIDPNSYWFCVRRSDPHNTAFHRRPKFMDYIDDAAPTAVSADDLTKLNQAEEDAEKYIDRLEEKCGK